MTTEPIRATTPTTASAIEAATDADPTADIMWRRSNDSSTLATPRAFLRVFVEPGGLEAATAFYEDLQGVERDMWFTFREYGIALSAVGGFLLIEGTAATVERFRSTTGTLLVPELAPYLERLAAAGAEILEPLRRVPTGSGVTARHADGTIVEYVEHRPTPEGR
ncbi:VOC family protein [Embleya sp. NPDC008237]|uniref:VOC family protein n=1 Tax=Embleya sp. NPDC008237 TaxID=3363978 RepID=UPI0036E3742B